MRASCSFAGKAAKLTDEELAFGAADGEIACFTELVRRHERSVRSFLNRVTGGEGADDLAQDTFLKAWTMAGSYRGEGPYRGWLMRIAWRQFLSAHRRRAPGLGSGEPEVFTPDETARIDVKRALARLPERERAAAVLCFGHGYSHAEAATILELPLGTLKSIVARARKSLAQQLEGHRR